MVSWGSGEVVGFRYISGRLEGITGGFKHGLRLNNTTDGACESTCITIVVVLELHRFTCSVPWSFTCELLGPVFPPVGVVFKAFTLVHLTVVSISWVCLYSLYCCFGHHDGGNWFGGCQGRFQSLSGGWWRQQAGGSDRQDNCWIVIICCGGWNDFVLFDWAWFRLGITQGWYQVAGWDWSWTIRLGVVSQVVGGGVIFRLQVSIDLHSLHQSLPEFSDSPLHSDLLSCAPCSCVSVMWGALCCIELSWLC